ncbi:hypothetical protein ACFWA4_05980 [Streptomyces sp. NPDC060011]|uniref:hypothetical protein n=1 Tax=Streptomyces sp. NPDC060011 TaxID=3347037 RepID=UPI0036CD5260
MSEWGIALIAAGSAVAGSIVTGWYTRSAGLRQAEAAKHAGDRQADALLRTVQDTLVEQRRARLEESRRDTYVEFLKAAHEATVNPHDNDLAREMYKCLTQVQVAGPYPVVMVALGYWDRVREWRADSTDDQMDAMARAHSDFIIAVQRDLGIETGFPIPRPQPPAPAS